MIIYIWTSSNYRNINDMVISSWTLDPEARILNPAPWILDVGPRIHHEIR